MLPHGSLFALSSITSFSYTSMGDLIKALAKHKPQDIDKVINEQLSEQEKRALKDILQRVLKDLPGNTSTGPKRMKSQTPAQCFRYVILPKIDRCLTTFEEQEESVTTTSWNPKPEFHIDFQSLTLDASKELHKKMLEEELSMTRLSLLMKRQRGVLYLHLYRIRDRSISPKDWFKQHFNVVYSTATRYMALAMLISRYPRLIVCELSFEELLFHKERLLKHISSDSQLGARLSMPLDVSALNQAVNIKAAENITIPPNSASDTTFNAVLDANEQDGQLEHTIACSSPSSMDWDMEDMTI